MLNSNTHSQTSKSQGNAYRTSNQLQVHEKKTNFGNEMMCQKSKQCYQQEQLQDQALIQYYIFEDYQNLINLIYSLQTVNDYFKDDPNNEMVVVCRNKVICQLNLSNTIHQDIQQTYKDPNYLKLIKKEKQKVQEMVSRLPPNIKNSIYMQMYNQNSLSENIKSTYQKLEKINVTPDFNQNVVSQILSSIQIIDQKVGQINIQKQYVVPSENDILEKAKQYQNLTQYKLEVSFPRKLQSQSQSQINLPQRQLQASQQFGRSQSCKNLPQQFQQQIKTQHQQQKQQSNQHQQKGKQVNHLKNYINLGNC